MQKREAKSSVLKASKNLPTRAAFAYNTNVDAVGFVDSLDIPAVLPAELGCLPECMGRGTEKEVYVGRSALDFLLKRFYGKFELRIGGQAGNMALCAARLGVVSLVHSASAAREQMMLLNRPNVLVAGKGGFVKPAKIRPGGHPSVHVVLEFPGNRFIATFDPLNSEMSISRDFEREMKLAIPKTDKAVISGFHLLSRGNIRKKISEIAQSLEEWKRLNPRLMLHLEFADFFRMDVLGLVVRKIVPICDSIGMNEVEIEQARLALGIGRCKNAVRLAVRMLSAADNVDSIVLHTAGFAFAASRSVGEEELKDSLTFGGSAASFMARRGRPPSLPELKKFSAALKYEKATVKIPECEFNAALVPSFFVERPKHTIGLGDCFTAGYFLTLPQGR